MQFIHVHSFRTTQSLSTANTNCGGYMITVLTASQCIFVGVCMPRGKNLDHQVRKDSKQVAEPTQENDFTWISSWHSTCIRDFDSNRLKFEPTEILWHICWCHQDYLRMPLIFSGTELRSSCLDPGGHASPHFHAFPAYVSYVISSLVVFETYWIILNVCNFK